MFKKILIANRGEIACRIMRTARRMGVKTVAVYSHADKNALHRKLADEAISIGGRDMERGVEPYLIGERIIEAALNSGAEAVHPGYGFLSENPDFVEAVEKAGLVFIGPSASAIRAMGLKDAAKTRMEKAGVPVVPGYHGDNQDAEFLAEEAEKIGYPVLIKARAGGGGKGMRMVARQQDFFAALEGAIREGETSFGDGRVLIEKYINAPRHIEIQVFGDNHGNAVHLFERDCSLQRRHQKVIEEAPAPGMNDAMRAAMGNAAVTAAKSIAYSGAGTIEFIVDGSQGLRPDRFWFMEMNTRLQVEHPVTEAITGLDLVEWQLRIASGEPLPLNQNELSITGHAFEARLYAEDVRKGFLPATGTLQVLEFSQNARIDTGVEQGDTISPFYDPMIAKITTHAATREAALEALDNALAETLIAGTVTNAAFLRALCQHHGFAAGKVDTGLIERDKAALTLAPQITPDIPIAAAAALVGGTRADKSGPLSDPFDRLPGFALHLPQWQTLTLALGEELFPVSFRMGEDLQPVYARVNIENGHREPLAENPALKTRRFGRSVAVFAEVGSFEFVPLDPLDQSSSEKRNPDLVFSPMPGLVKRVHKRVGDGVKLDEPLIILEAMKMEHTLTAPRAGVIGEINVAEGDQVEDGTLLIALERENDAPDRKQFPREAKAGERG